MLLFDNLLAKEKNNNNNNYLTIHYNFIISDEEV